MVWMLSSNALQYALQIALQYALQIALHYALQGYPANWYGLDALQYALQHTLQGYPAHYCGLDGWGWWAATATAEI